MRLTRRSFLAASAAMVASPAVGAPAVPRFTDVAIVGAGAAGIAAARRVAAAGRQYVLFEATDRVGGRCITDTRLFGVPFDLGAHWIHLPDVNPVAKLASRAGLDVYPAPPGQKLRVGRRNAREGEMEDFLAASVRANRAIIDAGRGRVDVSGAHALPKELGDWRPSVEFLLGPYAFGKDLADISAFDYSRATERDIDAFCRQGFGTLLAKLAEGITVQLSTPVNRIDISRGVELDTARGKLNARAVIVTASTNLLKSGKIRFYPELPKRQLDAIAGLSLGSYDRVALELPDNPLGLQRDDLVFEKTSDARTAALLANVSGTPLCFVDVAGRFGRELSARGTAEMTAFAIDWLANLYGADVKKAVGRTHATRWNDAPWIQGAASVASVGSQGARRALIEPVRERIYFAGEAAHETLWGTVGGAWESGERAADAILRRMGPVTPPRQRRQPTR